MQTKVKTKNENSRKLFSVIPMQAFEKLKQSKNKKCFLKPNAPKCLLIPISPRLKCFFFNKSLRQI